VHRTLTAAAIFLLFTLLVHDLAAQQTLLLDNGDRLSGRLTRIEGTTWIFRYGFGEAKVPAARVRGFSAPDPIGVRLADSTVAAMTIEPVDDTLVATLADGTVRLVGPRNLTAVGAPDALELLRPIRIGIFTPIWQYWGATGSLGFSDNSGNSRSRGFSADFQLARKAPKDRIAAGLGVNREFRPDENGDLVPAVSKYYGSVRFDIYFSPRFFTFAATLQERDRFQGIDLRSNYSGGLGLQAVAQQVTDWRLSFSSGVRVEYYMDNVRETVAVLNGGSELRQQVGPALFDWKASWSGSVKDFSDFRLRSSATLTTEVYHGLGFRLGLQNDFNNRPRPDRVKHDMLFTTALAYSVGVLK
jgi:putative salt-induced outer membrane protein YdiY